MGLCYYSLWLHSSYRCIATCGGTSSDVQNISHYAAIVLLFIYGFALLFHLKTHAHVFATEAGHGHHEEPTMTNKNAWILLILATVLVAWMAHILVHSLEAAVDEWGMPELFIGVILLPFFGNAAEHFTAVIVAGKDKMDLSIAIAVGSSVQIALFAAPAMILFAWALGVPLTLEFGMLETAATLSLYWWLTRYLLMVNQIGLKGQCYSGVM